MGQTLMGFRGSAEGAQVDALSRAELLAAVRAADKADKAWQTWLGEVGMGHREGILHLGVDPAVHSSATLRRFLLRRRQRTLDAPRVRRFPLRLAC